MSRFVLENGGAPFGALTFATELDAPTSADALCALAVDFRRYESIEPRLTSARWLDDPPPRAGSRAEVLADIPFTIGAVKRAIGRPHGIATLWEFAPPGRLAYSLETPRAVGCMVAEFSQTKTGCDVRVRGWILPLRVPIQVALAPLTSILEPLASQAVRRGILRAANGLSAA